MDFEELSTTAGTSDSESPARRNGQGGQEISIVIRKTFLDVDEGGGLLQRDRRLRRCRSEEVVRQEPLTYQPGAYSEKSAKKQYRHAEGGTVMLRNLPNNYTRDMLLELLDEHGLSGRYDFVYLPCDFRRDANLGYAFVNLVDSEAVNSLWKTFDGFQKWALPSAKVSQVKWSGPLQGFEAHVQRYRNSPVMHKSVPEKYKPVIFKDGQQRAFPEPNRRIKAPSM